MYKKYEFKPPDMIKERIDKDYSSILHNTLTSIPKVNKTDVETLRSTFGVRISESYASLLAYRAQSFASISKATSDQLRNLPGFGQIKVRNIENAFKKPFRNDATAKLTDFPHTELSQQNQIQTQEQCLVDGQNNRQVHSPAASSSKEPRPRESSPTWDIELDLNDEEIYEVMNT